MRVGMTTDDDKGVQSDSGDTTPIIANKRPLSPEQTSIFHHTDPATDIFLHGQYGQIKMRGYTMVILYLIGR
jgi:hypothetical protein